MLKKGFLASNRFYACIAHNDELLDSYFNAFDETLSTISIIKDDKNEIIFRQEKDKPKDYIICLSLCGRGEKDLDTIQEHIGKDFE